MSEPISTVKSSQISHDDAQQAAQDLIDHYFHNCTPRRVKVCIPREPDDTDILLCGYIEQQREALPDALRNLANEWEDCGLLACHLLDAPDFSVEIYTTPDGFLKARLDCEGAKALANCVIKMLRSKGVEQKVKTVGPPHGSAAESKS